MKKIITAILIISVLTVSGLFAEAKTGFGAAGAKTDSAYTLEEMLKYAIEDEYLAKAEYELIISKYGNIRPFSNIMKAEEQHISWLKTIYKDYGMTLPEDAASDHVVLPSDLKSAFQTGVTAEIENIGMYDRFLEESLPDDVKDLFERLRNASENHLSAFKNNLDRY
jgi:hypothetical protein